MPERDAIMVLVWGIIVIQAIVCDKSGASWSSSKSFIYQRLDEPASRRRSPEPAQWTNKAFERAPQGSTQENGRDEHSSIGSSPDFHNQSLTRPPNQKYVQVPSDVRKHLINERLNNRSDVLARKHSPKASPLRPPHIEGNFQESKTADDINVARSPDYNYKPPSTNALEGVSLTHANRRRSKNLAHSTSGAIYSEPRATHSGPQKAKVTPATTTQIPQLDYLARLYLDASTPREVRAHLGNTAYLLCRLRTIQQQEHHLSVSWVRNMQILTSDEIRYTSDERFRASHSPGSSDWILEIYNVNAQDEGVYECQVNSEPKSTSVSLYLHVITATIDILGQSPVYLNEGDQIKLTCLVEFSSQAELNRRLTADNEQSHPNDDTLDDIGDASSIDFHPQNPEPYSEPVAPSGFNSQHYIYWYKNNVSLEYNNPRGGIRVERRENTTNLQSVLTIQQSKQSDSGAYTCKILPELNDVSPALIQIIVGDETTLKSTSGNTAISIGTSSLTWLLQPLLYSLVVVCYIKNE